MERNELHKSMPTGELDSMKRLWDKQRSNMDGHQLISDDELMKAINSSNVSKPMTWKTWQRVAAVAVVVIATLWLCIWGGSESDSTSVGPTLAETETPKPDTAHLQPVLETPPTSKPHLRASVRTPWTSTPTLGTATITAPEAEPMAPQQLEAVETTEPTHTEQLIAQTVSKSMEWPHRPVDTIVAHSNRLVQYSEKSRKSLSETLFEPILASL